MDETSLPLRALHAARCGHLIYRKHARERMVERGISPPEVEGAIRGATTAIDQPENGTVRLQGGMDLDD